MSEIKKNPSETASSPAETSENGQTQFEQQRYTRRQALRKFGFGAGLSAFMLLSVDDLARMVGRELQKRAGDNQVANQIAKEFQSAGVALASGPSGCTGGCEICCAQYYSNQSSCLSQYNTCIANRQPIRTCQNAEITCYEIANDALSKCLTSNPCSGCSC